MQETPLYNSEVILEFDEARHQYRARINGRRYKVPSVTRVVSVIDKSGPLMGWAVKEAINTVRGSVLPGVEYAETYLESVFDAAKKAHRQVKKEAADAGTLVHRSLEGYIRRTPLGEGGDTPGYRAGVDWLQTHNVTVNAIERRIYSKRHRYSGTLDLLGHVDGILTIVDWKTSKAIYEEYVLQVAAYRHAYQEETGENIERAIILKLGKEDGSFEPHEYDAKALDKAFGAFVSALHLYRYLNKGKA